LVVDHGRVSASEPPEPSHDEFAVLVVGLSAALEQEKVWIAELEV
jgi:hypothetical protein